MRREYLYSEKKIILFEIKKKTVKNLLKITRYIRLTKALSTTIRACLKLSKHVFTKRWKVAVTAYISKNK